VVRRRGNAYGAANTEHGRVLGQMAGLDQRLSAHVDQSAEVVAAGRRNLDAVRQWVVDAAASVPPGQAGETMKMAIAQKGLRMMSRVRGLATLMLVGAMALTGCSNVGTREPEHQRWGGLVKDLRAQWGAEPGIDLLTGVAVPARAYLESFQLTQVTGNADDLYPGFTRAVPPNEPEGPDPSAWDLRPSMKHPIRSALIGNIRFHIRSVEPSGRNVAVTVCHYNYGAAEQQAEGAYASIVAGEPAPDTGIFAIRVMLVGPADESASALPPQKGPAVAPSNDVFGDWQVIGHLTSSSTSSRAQWPTYEADEAACVETAPDPFERRAFLLNGEHPRSDFPTSPPSPGWPEGTSE
jgi:hypothetical protein